MKQNNDKTEFLIIGTPGQLKRVNYNDIHMFETDISSSEQAHNLGIIFDKEINSKVQINNISKAGYYRVRNLAAIRNTLDLDSAKIAAHAFITSTWDYGNSLLYGLPYTKLTKLQMVQNASARVLIQATKNDRISMTAVRKNLHWLPIKARIDFKIISLAWKAYNGKGPKYLNDLLDKKRTTHITRSADTNLLKISATKLVTCDILKSSTNSLK